ncbi:MAG: hypothetical protein IMY71_02830 [Bacteroidetes bacterium]|nr:hypothetical protein [Bacteroidota bacterium]
MIKKRSVFLSFIFLGMLVIPFTMEAQENQTLYYMGLPQSRLMNPALQSSCGLYLGLPAVSSVYFHYSNNSFSPDDFIFKGTGEYADSLITILHPSYNIADFLDKLPGRIYISPEAHVQLFAFGFRSRDIYFTFDITERANLFLSLPKDFMTLAFHGNNAFVGGTADFSDLTFDMTEYRQYGVSLSKKINKDLSFGAKGKLLFGKANLSLKNADLGITIDEGNVFTHTLHSDISLNVSAPITVTTDSEGFVEDLEISEEMDTDDGIIDFIMNTGNMGVAVDLGAVYDITDDFTLSASVVDLGYINWKQDVYNFVSKGTFNFEGIDTSPEFDVNDDRDLGDVAEAMLDSIADIFKPLSQEETYKTMLPTKIYLGGTFNVSEKLNLGLLSRSQIYKGKIQQALTVSANTNLGNALMTSVSYTMSNNSYNNLGVGLSSRGGPFQFYFVSDHIPVTFNKIQFEDNGDVTSFPFPTNMKRINIRFGLNVVFGCNAKRFKDKPLVL